MNQRVEGTPVPERSRVSSVTVLVVLTVEYDGVGAALELLDQIAVFDEIVQEPSILQGSEYPVLVVNDGLDGGGILHIVLQIRPIERARSVDVDDSLRYSTSCQGKIIPRRYVSRIVWFCR